MVDSLSRFCMIFLLCLLMLPVVAQKKKTIMDTAQLRREAEFYFTEGEKFYILEDYAKALVLFKKSAEVDRLNAAAHFKLSQIYEEMGDLINSLENSIIATDLQPTNKYYQAQKASIFARLNEFEKAGEIYRYMIDNIEGTEEYLFELAAIYLYQQNYEEAYATYDEIEKAFGMSEEIIIQKQTVLLEQKKIDEALIEGKRLMEEFPEEERYVLRQMELLDEYDRKDEAGEIARDFLAKNDNSGTVRLALSRMQMDNKDADVSSGLKNMERAFNDPNVHVSTKVAMLAEYRLTVKEDNLKDAGVSLANILTDVHPVSGEAWAVKGDIYQAIGAKSKAKDAYVKALEFTPGNLQLWQNSLQLLTELGNVDSVLLLAEEALEVYPNQAMIYYYNGQALLGKQQYEEASYVLEQGKRLSGSNLQLISIFNNLLGEAYNGTAEYDKSDRAFQATLEFDPTNALVLNNYSYFLALRGEKLELAEEMVTKAVKENPDNVQFIDTYAWVLFHRKKYKEAARVIEKAIQSPDVSAVHYEHYGDILFKLGEIDQAVIQWKKALEKAPGSKDIERKIAEKSLYE